MVTKVARDEGSPYIAMQIVGQMVDQLKDKGFTGVHIKIRVAVRAFARAGIRIGKIEDVTPLAHDGTMAKGGGRGRRI